ncbi:MAG: lytic transglycosylase domain-containing protein [Candidatus Accumulibacter phosphatis]|uniref:Soluble lytic murein transglycosylase n=1 Tax=Candidatus Accumulibacter vicinus TaxID=2954382 RepID=A0A084Y3B4_9PROT|nr:lytic transglycosylase domain-containing protein [Candidatus Accumulibacter vicinus]KFB69208.1 MAG: Soluble lytic murein transglycosylase precursor [Candidatus Accumulibacter vicinus]MCQ1550391.1 lytic transglycosylase domain-containing protein [Candidatus Accumulibacter phosphatis]
MQQRMQISGFILTLGLSLVSVDARANIYGYIDEQGAAHFATEKIDARYQLFMRGQQFDAADSTATGPAKPELLRYLSKHPNLKKFEPLLKVASNEFSIEFALLKAIMAAESGFNPGAISPRGAIGLMQVMPATAERYGLQGDKNKTIEQKLADPEINIRLGARYLRDLHRMFPNQQELVLASYNAGEGAVQQYRNKIPPYPETRNYVQLVTQIYQLYQDRPAPRKVEAAVFSGSGYNAKRIYLTIPGRRNLLASAAAHTE